MVSAKQTKKALKDEHDTRLQRRLMGTAVLIALAVIFLPLIFDGSGTESQFTSIEPLAPEPPYDERALEEISLSEISDLTVIEFVDEKNPGDVNQDSTKGMDDQISKQILEPPASNLSPPTNTLSDNDVKSRPAIKKSNTQSKNAPISGKSWLIQTASFKDKINALSLRGELKKAGYPVIVKVGDAKGSVVFRVYVGPVQGRVAAVSIKSGIEKLLKRETLLIAE